MQTCGSFDHLSRRSLLAASLGMSGISWLTPLAESLARADGDAPTRKRPRSLIVLWMAGGPSQLETFDPHPGTKIAHDATKAIDTSAKGVQIADSLPRIAEQMQSISLVRSLVSKEGDHERASHNLKTGFRPDPTLVHPSLGAVMCHQLADDIEIPRHVSILPGQFPARGGYLGNLYDAFKTFDPAQPIPDVRARVSDSRAAKRLADLAIVEASFARGRIKDLAERTSHGASIEAARKMMSSEQLKAFDVSGAPAALKEKFGDSPFGRACLAAVQLMEVGVRCVEVTLDGWDTHTNNEALVRGRCEILDPAFAALITELKARDLFDSTIVLWLGEFGRTPRVNPTGGRDHWPHGFTAAVTGGNLAGGRVVGETSTEPDDNQAADKTRLMANPRPVEDLHATILHSLGIDYKKEVQTPIGRPMMLSQGSPIQELLA